MCLVLLAGCNSVENAGLPIKGSVSLKGQPLDQGTILFSPVDPNTPTSTGAPITNGKYEIPALNGLVPGMYEVRISSGEPGTVAEEPAPGESGPPAKDRIPPQYNVETTLRAEVKPGEENVFNYEIP
jgi:hypothetical protein